MIYSFKMLDGEKWWGGSSYDGVKQPFDERTEYECDFRVLCLNQTMPLFLSDKGRYIWSDSPFEVKIARGIIEISGEGVSITNAGATLRDSYICAMNAHFLIENKKLPEVFFRTAQYNTWMQFTYEPTEAGVLEYAHAIVDNGFEPGVLIIDEGWHGRYGLWEFDLHKFPNPKKMIDELHSLGFKVMLWVVPFVTPDGKDFSCSRDESFNPESFNDLYYRNAAGEIALVEWWNGISAILDMTKECDRRFLEEKLDRLIREYGVDGFKFDGGNVENYAERWLRNGPGQTEHTPHELNIAWNEFGRKYEFHEYKDTYLGGGKAVIERLHDRAHSWDNNGLNTLIPSAIVQGLTGHPYICPDMIGGGSWHYRTIYSHLFDEELFVRMAQCSALFPMMQFSWAPWEALGEENLGYVREAAHLHRDMADEIVALVENARTTGEPIIRSLEYSDPAKGYAGITDEFMLGNDILVAPVLKKGAEARNVVFPAGEWISQTDGKIYHGGTEARIDAPISVLPWFRRI